MASPANGASVQGSGDRDTGPQGNKLQIRPSVPAPPLLPPPVSGTDVNPPSHGVGQLPPVPPEIAPVREPESPRPDGGQMAVGEPGLMTSPVPGNREELERLLRSFECARLTRVATRGPAKISGFVASDSDLRRLKSAIDSKYANEVGVLDVVVRQWPYCETMLVLEKHTNVGRNGESGFSVRPNHPDRTYRRGEKFAVEIIPPSNGLDYLYLAYMNSAGEIAQLYPGPGLDGKIRPGEKTISLGSGGEMTIGEPYGQDLLIALASDAPIAPRFADQPNVAQNFLGALKRALSGGSSAMNVESRLVFIKTGP